MRKLLEDQKGQAIVEYVLMVAIALTLVGGMASLFRGSLGKLWKRFANEITAACPSCPPSNP